MGTFLPPLAKNIEKGDSFSILCSMRKVFDLNNNCIIDSIEDENFDELALVAGEALDARSQDSNVIITFASVYGIMQGIYKITLNREASIVWSHETENLIINNIACQIDTRIVPLVTKINEENLLTEFSCEGQLPANGIENKGYILFSKDTQAVEFLERTSQMAKDSSITDNINLRINTYQGRTRGRIGMDVHTISIVQKLWCPNVEDLFYNFTFDSPS